MANTDDLRPLAFITRNERLLCVLVAYAAGYGLTVLFAARLGGAA